MHPTRSGCRAAACEPRSPGRDRRMGAAGDRRPGTGGRERLGAHHGDRGRRRVRRPARSRAARLRGSGRVTTPRSTNNTALAQGRPRTLVGSEACPPGRSRSGRRRTSRTSAPRSRCPTAARRDASSRSATTRRRSSRTTWKRLPTGSSGPRRTRRPATTPTPTATSGRWCATTISPGRRARGPACDRTRDCRARLVARRVRLVQHLHALD